jgi:hypothetical protein
MKNKNLGISVKQAKFGNLGPLLIDKLVHFLH